MPLNAYTLSITFITPSSSSSSSTLYKPQFKSLLSHSLESSFCRKAKAVVAKSVYSKNDDDVLEQERNLGRACQVYICNLPKSFDAAHLFHLFTIFSFVLRVHLDVGRHEMRVKLSVEMNPDWSDSKRTIYYEALHKLYVGNLAKTVNPEQLRNLFSRFGYIASARVLHDYKQGKMRVYAFISFQSKAERDAAMSLTETEFNGRTLIVKEGVEKPLP
ncbi:hypothetical protein RJT34_15736 [Clitoria ternatea]|uniref:Small ribosomal subunit protein cS22 n=1 Tax=Clitoria ternatea TaxID=43366 RepID=A0AAN9PC92_CLITE